MISAAYAATAGAVAEAGPIYQDPHFWVNVAIVLVIVLAWRPVARALSAALDARAARIKARLDEAAKLREDAQEMLATYRRKERDAMKEAESIIAQAQAEAERLAAQAGRELEESLKRREDAALQRIAQAEAQALKDVQNFAVDVAIAAARQVLATNIAADQAAALVDGAIRDLPRRLH
jgi:F-type H+-transporting ATPase subunit b